MPEEKYTWLPREEILRFEEISRLVDVFCSLGVDKVRLTGGEPLLRQNLSALVSMLSSKPALKDLALTTNGVFLAEQAEALFSAGLHRITVSLDTLQPARFEKITRRDQLGRVFEGLQTAKRVGFSSIKLNSVVMRGFNDDELCDLIELSKQNGYEVRFIEYMDVGGATRWGEKQVVSQREILQKLSSQYGEITPVQEPNNSAPAERFRLPDGTLFGVIASTTTPFCGSCDRSRVTADGTWYRCLYARSGTDLRGLLRGGASEEALKQVIEEGWTNRSDRGAEERLFVQERGPFVKSEELQRDPRLEMHTRGG